MAEQTASKGAVLPDLAGGTSILRLLDSLPYYVMLVDENHEIILVNKALRRQYDMEPEEVLGGYCPKVIHGASGPISKCPLEKSAQMETPEPTSSVFKEAGSWLKSAIYPIKGLEHNGKTVFFHTVHDITARREAEQKHEKALVDLARVSSRMLEQIDPYASGHSREVGKMAKRVGKRLGLDDELVEGLYLGGTLHDIGKISVPPGILAKTGELSELEWEAIKTHPGAGFEKILKGADFPWPIAEMVLHHHERLDGSGYPDGLQGDEISLEAKILAVCDVTEAMSSRRPYRPAKSESAVLKELKEGKEKKYDSEIVEIMVKMIGEGEVEFG